MSGYIGKVQIGSDVVLVGSTLYGICKSSATATNKFIQNTNHEDDGGNFINTNFNSLVAGTTVHIKFTEGNSALSGVKFQIGTSQTLQDVVNIPACPRDTVLSFTLDEDYVWVANDNIDTNTTYTFTEGSVTGAFTVTPSDSTAQIINIHGLLDAAYKASTTAIDSNSTHDQLPTAATVYSYVQAQTGGLSGLTGAMHFRGVATSEPSGNNIPTGISDYTNSSPEPGDVVLYQEKEYVWTGSVWRLLGDEGSYALKSSADYVTEVTNFTANTLPSLTVTAVTASWVNITAGTEASLTTTSVNIPNVTQAGTATQASVTAGVLHINVGVDTIIATAPITVTAVTSFTPNSPTVVTSTAVSIGSASDWDAGSQAALSTTDTLVVVPNSTTSSI